MVQAAPCAGACAVWRGDADLGAEGGALPVQAAHDRSDGGATAVRCETIGDGFAFGSGDTAPSGAASTDLTSDSASLRRHPALRADDQIESGGWFGNLHCTYIVFVMIDS